MSPRPTIIGLGFLSVLAGLPGCAILEKPPTVTVSEIRPTSASGHVDSVEIVLNVANDNTDALELDDVRYSVRSSSGSTYEGRRAALTTIPGKSTGQVIVPAVVPSGAVMDSRVSGSLRYLAPGRLAELLFETGVRRPSVSFRSSD